MFSTMFLGYNSKTMKIALGMSGGVDSSVAAHLLTRAGHEVTGVFLECWRAPGCRAQEDRQDALKVALGLGIPFKVLDFRQAYKERVVDTFFADYARGLTPNPDIWCNTVIKFGMFYDWAMEHGFDAIATGHYAGVEDVSGVSVLCRPVDEHKDQTYFLYRTTPEQLEHVVFPLADLPKSQVRELATEFGIAVADKPDSQGICFIGDIDVRDFLREHLGEKPGEVVDVDGNVIGEHRGVWFYTIGQRHGFTLFPRVRTLKSEWKDVLPPLYVIAKDAAANRLVVGYGADTLQETIQLLDTVWSPAAAFAEDGSPQSPVRVCVRHTGELLPAQVKITGSDSAFVTLETAQRGIAPGQSAVVYGGEGFRECWGGGVIG